MRCKACGRVLSDSARKCPYCGVAVSFGNGRPGEEFKWNIQEYSKPKKKPEIQMDIDWASGEIVDHGTGRTYSQSGGWTEPEEARNLFTFDTVNEDLQREVNKRVDTIVDNSPKTAHPEITERQVNMFTTPSQMEMRDFAALLDDEKPGDGLNWSISSNLKSEDKDVFGYSKGTSAGEFVFGSSLKDKERPFLDWSLATPAAARARAADIAASEAAMRDAERRKSPAPEKAAAGKYAVPVMMQDQQYDPFETKTEEMTDISIPAFLNKGDRITFAPSEIDLYEAIDEKAGKDIGPSAAYMADMEEERAQETFKHLIGVEKKFSEDMDRVVFMSEEDRELEKQVQLKREQLIDEPDISFQTIEDAYDQYRVANGIPKAETIEEKPVEVKVESDDDAAAEESAEAVEEKEEDTVSEKTQEIRPVTEEGEEPAEEAEEPRPEEVLADSEEDVPFWERKKPVSRMTITDIFGPEARELMNQADEETEEPAAEEVAEEIEEPAAEEVAEEIEEPAAEEAVEEIEEPAAEEVAEEIEEPAEEEVAEEIEEPAAEEVAEEIEEPAAEEVAEEIEEPVAEEVAEEIEEPAAEEVAEEIEEPAAEEVAEEIEEPANEEPEEFVYTIDEERLTKQAIRDMSEEELEAAVEAAAIREMEKESAREEAIAEKHAEKAAEWEAALEEEKAEAEAKAEDAEENEEAPEKTEEKKPAKKKDAEDKPKEKKEKKKKAAKKADKKSDKKADKKAARKAAKAAKEVEEDYDDDDDSLSLRIMRLIIGILLVLVVIEVLIFVVKIVAPTSAIGLAISKIESGFGASLLGKSIFRL